MSVGLYMDEQFHGAVTAALRLRGVDVVTAQDDGMCGTPDEVLLDRAGQLGRLVVTSDRDCLTVSAARLAAGASHSEIVYAPPNGPTIGECIRDLEIVAKATDAADWIDTVQRLPL